jgi:hypothetical protein
MCEKDFADTVVLLAEFSSHYGAAESLPCHGKHGGRLRMLS